MYRDFQPLLYYYYRGVGLFSDFFGARDKRLRVLLYHDVPVKQYPDFIRQLDFISKYWNFVSPNIFSEMIDGNEPVKKDSVLLTFDDGFISNRSVAEEILNKLGIKALFFVVSDFIELEDQELSRSFVAQTICPRLSADQIPDSMMNMRWSDLEALLEQGHMIGGHTKTHSRLSKITEKVLLHEEIESSADRLEKHLGVNIDHFAYTFGDIGSVTPEAMMVARNRFKYIYSGLRGNNAQDIPTSLRYRDSIAPTAKNAFVGSLLEGGADFRYRSSAAVLNSWMIE